MCTRLELLRWVNMRCPNNKASSIESMSDGRHLMMILQQMGCQNEHELQKCTTLNQRIANLEQVQQQIDKLGLEIRLDIYRIANKHAQSILNVLKLFRKSSLLGNSIGYSSEIPCVQQKYMIIEEPSRLNEEIPCLTSKIRDILLRRLDYKQLQLELIRTLDDVSLRELEEEVLNQQETTTDIKQSKLTQYQSLHSTQFYRTCEPNIFGSQYSFSQNNPSKRANHQDSLFIVSDEKGNLYYNTNSMN